MEAASVSSGSLLEMWTLWPHHRPAESELACLLGNRVHRQSVRSTPIDCVTSLLAKLIHCGICCSFFFFFHFSCVVLGMFAGGIGVPSALVPWGTSVHAHLHTCQWNIPQHRAWHKWDLNKCLLSEIKQSTVR